MRTDIKCHKKAIETRTQKMERAFTLQETHNKFLSWNIKLRHCQTVVRPKILNAVETLKLIGTIDLEQLEKI